MIVNIVFEALQVAACLDEVHLRVFLARDFRLAPVPGRAFPVLRDLQSVFLVFGWSILAHEHDPDIGRYLVQVANRLAIQGVERLKLLLTSAQVT